MGVVSINYQEGNKDDLGYKSVEVSYNFSANKKIFDSGNFITDWYNAMKFIIQDMPEGEPLSFSSSVDHFIMDGAPYSSAYLHIENNIAELKYIDKTDNNYIYSQKSIYQSGIEFFVPSGTQPTWAELKGISKNIKKQD